jgi:hypothetical protein
VIVHREHIADRRLVEKCPWLGVKVGQAKAQSYLYPWCAPPIGPREIGSECTPIWGLHPELNGDICHLLGTRE